MFNWMKSLTEKKPVQEPREYVMEPRISLEDINNIRTAAFQPTIPTMPPALVLPTVPSNVMLKRLKWVDYQGKVAIVTALDSSGYANIDFVGTDGLTTSSTRVNAGNLRLAQYLQIPECRRRDISPAYAATLGYM
jgi:hypothetical protein